MITLPDFIVPRQASFTPVDMGFTQEGSAGLGDRIDRPGNHWACTLDFPPMLPDVARVFASRITQAISAGLRVEIPLLGVDQGIPGAPVVDGDEPGGTTLPLRGLTPSYAVKEGFWLTVVDGASGQGCTHMATATGIADASGALAVGIVPALRVPFADGDTVLLARPTIEGALRAVPSWVLTLDRLVRLGAEITIEEVA